MSYNLWHLNYSAKTPLICPKQGDCVWAILSVCGWVKTLGMDNNQHNKFYVYSVWKIIGHFKYVLFDFNHKPVR